MRGPFVWSWVGLIPAAATASTAAATIAPSAAAAAASAPVPAAAAAAFALSRLVDYEVTSAKFAAVKLGDCIGCIVAVAQGDETEAARASGVTVGDDNNLVGVPSTIGEDASKHILIDIVGKVPYIQFLSHPNLLALFGAE